MKIGLFIKQGAIDETTTNDLIHKLVSLGFEYDNKTPEYVFTIGGDGTFLKAVHTYFSQLSKITFIPVNKGKLGYFSDFTLEEFRNMLSNLASEEYVTNSYSLLKGEFNDEVVYGVNEIRLENAFKTLTAKVYVNGEYLETFRGNGLLVATSKGSSAYNKSLSGAVIDSALEVMQLTEIAPINNRLYESIHSSLVLPKDSEIVFKGDFTSSYIGNDHLVKTDANFDELKITLSDIKVNILSKKDRSFIYKLNDAFIGK